MALLVVPTARNKLPSGRFHLHRESTDAPATICHAPCDTHSDCCPGAAPAAPSDARLGVPISGRPGLQPALLSGGTAQESAPQPPGRSSASRFVADAHSPHRCL